MVSCFFIIYKYSDILILFLILGMSDDEILRAEMVAQLCMNDRTHSSLLDLISFQEFNFLLVAGSKLQVIFMD